MKETIKLGIILLIITAVSAGILSVSNNLTKDKIAEIEMEGSIGALKEIFGEEKRFTALEESQLKEIIEADASVLEIFEVYNGENLEGYAIKTVTVGYGGDIVTLTWVSKDEQNIVGMKILEHSETPGLGAKAEEPEFTERFAGKSISEEVEVEVLSGATITSKAVMFGVNNAKEVFNTELSK